MIGPSWLLDQIRPRHVEPRRSLYAEYADRDGHAYALAAIRGELGLLSAAAPGGRNQVAYKVACRLIELTLADWAHLDVEEVQGAYMHACEMANAATASGPLVGQFLDGEAWGVWFSAKRHVREPATLPDPSFATGTTWTPPPLPPGQHPDSTRTGGGQSDFDQAGERPANPFTSPGQLGTSTQVAAPLINGPSELAIVDDPWERAVAVELSRLLIREEADKRRRARAAVRTDFDKIALDDAGMDEIPEAIPLVTRWLELDCLARINGPSGHGKSFVVLDLAACVATGTTWHGHAVTPTRVCYVVAEGVRGTAKRARAWCQRHGVPSTGITFVPRPVQISGPEWDAFKTWCARRQFGMIIFDTQARSTVGVDENDATEMGEIVASLDEIKRATGACCLLVHHRGLRGDQGRGSSTVRGAVDTELDVTRQGATITLKSTKQKDGSDPDPIRFTMNELGTSVVLIAETDAISSGGPFTSPAPVVMSLRERCAVAIAHCLIDAPGLTRAEAQTHARVSLSLGGDESTRRVVRRAWSDLERLGRLAKTAGREAYFFVELDGAPVMQANPDKAVKDGPEVHIP